MSPMQDPVIRSIALPRNIWEEIRKKALKENRKISDQVRHLLEISLKLKKESRHG